MQRDRYAWVDQMYIPGLHAICAPVLNWQTEIEAATIPIARESALIEPNGNEMSVLKEAVQELSGTAAR